MKRWLLPLDAAVLGSNVLDRKRAAMEEAIVNYKKVEWRKDGWL